MKKKRQSTFGFAESVTPGRGPQYTSVPTQTEIFSVSVSPINNANVTLSPNEAARIFKVTGEAVKLWIFNKRLPAVKMPNGYWRIKRTDLEIFLRGRQKVGRRGILICTSKSDKLLEIIDAIKETSHDPMFANSFPDAVLKAIHHFPALLIFNISQREIDSWKMIKRIRATKTPSDIPILLIGDNAMSEIEAEQAVQGRVQGFLLRPVDKALLVSEIQCLLSRN